MTEEPTTQQTEQFSFPASDAWSEVGKQFEALGKSLAAALRAAWESEETRRRARNLQTSLETMVNEIGAALQEAANSPEGQQARQEVQKTAQSLHAVGRQTWQETQPHLVSALRRVSDGLQKVISQMEHEESGQAAPAEKSDTELWDCMTDHSWVQEFPGAITVCDANGIILEMNDRAGQVFQKEGGRALIGSNILDCHPEPARTKVRQLLESHQTNVYTIEKNGVRKLIYQSPWYRNGQFAGLVELALEIPSEMPHLVRKG